MNLPFRFTITEKGHEYVNDTKTTVKFLKKEAALHKKNNSNLPPLQSNMQYSILETLTSNPDLPSIKPFKNKRAQSLFFYENNKKLMAFHQKTLKDQQEKYQKPTIFSSISDPFDEKKWDFHQSSLNLLTRLNKKFDFSKTINSQFLGNENEKDNGTIDFTFYSPEHKLFSNNNNSKPVVSPKPNDSLMTMMQKTFYTKPLVKHLNEVEVIEKIQSKKIDYFQDKVHFFEGLKTVIKTKHENKEVNKKSKIMQEFEEEEKRIEENLDLFRNERERFKRRLLKYNKKKFDCKNRRNYVNS